MVQLTRMSRATSKLAAEPNVIPFIDVLLVLLIIFMVTAPKPTTDFNVDLPQGAPAPALITPTIVELRERDGVLVVSVDGEAVAVDALADLTFASAQRNNPDLPVERIYADARVFVRADQDIAYGNVVSVMDTLQHARFAKIGIFAEEADAG